MTKKEKKTRKNETCTIKKTSVKLDTIGDKYIQDG